MRHGSMHGSAPQGLGGHWRVAAGRGTARRGRRAARDREEYCILLKKRFYTRTSHPPKYAPHTYHTYPHTDRTHTLAHTHAVNHTHIQYHLTHPAHAKNEG
jgi:hypothetical protein